MNDLSKLLGWNIRSVHIDEDDTYLMFMVYRDVKTSTGQYQEYKVFMFYTSGDCCSTSWIENITGIKTVLDKRSDCLVTAVIEREMKEDDCIKIYGYTIKTVHGPIDIEFRNESNGYYGGSLHEACILPDKITFNKIESDEV